MVSACSQPVVVLLGIFLLSNPEEGTKFNEKGILQRK